jgi:eukaryotic-like serine/threonine-protein kinase
MEKMEKRIGAYDVLGKVKDGSIGTIWRVRGPAGRSLALKRISAAGGENPAKLKKFRKEFDVQARLDHPSIIKVHDYVEDPPQDFFTMDYFESESLKIAMYALPERVNRREFRILRQLAEALRHVHEKGIIHKDLKPENVLIDGDGAIRLIDFSLAQTRWDRWLQFGKRTEGTPVYMAPEQIRGERCDARTDAYAFGLIAYELLTKRLALAGKDHEACMKAHLRHPAPPLSDHLPEISPDLEELVQGLLEKEPARRPDLEVVARTLKKWETTDPALRRRQVTMFDAARPVPDPFAQAGF